MLRHRWSGLGVSDFGPHLAQRPRPSRTNVTTAQGQRMRPLSLASGIGRIATPRRNRPLQKAGAAANGTGPAHATFEFG
jgi:hypothetical protein